MANTNFKHACEYKFIQSSASALHQHCKRSSKPNATYVLGRRRTLFIIRHGESKWNAALVTVAVTHIVDAHTNTNETKNADTLNAIIMLFLCCYYLIFGCASGQAHKNLAALMHFDHPLSMRGLFSYGGEQISLLVCFLVWLKKTKRVT